MPRPRPTGPKLEQRRGAWSVVYWDGDTRRRLATGTRDLQGAQQFLADFETALTTGTRTLSVGNALDRYVTARTSKVMALKRLKDAAGALKIGLGPLRVDQLNQDLWDRYAGARTTRTPHRGKPGTHVPKPVSTGTLRREFNVLRAALRLAWKDGHLDKPPTITPPADSAPRDRYLTKDEARRLLAAAETPHVRMFVALAVFTGARKGAILALTWDRVNFGTGMIDFQEPGRRITGKRRSIVPMNGQLRAELDTAYQVRTSDTVIEYGGHAVPNGLRWSFAKLCQRAGLTWQPTPHHLKHSVASWLAMEGVPIDQAADWLATDPATLQRTYRKFDPTYLRSVAKALDL